LELKFENQHIPYSSTNRFSKIALDYLNEDEELRPFFDHEVSVNGIKDAIKERKKMPVNRRLLYDELAKQYDGLETSEAVENNLRLLLQENTFTVCSAHQPNLFTGHLYFVYKIIHAIKIADSLKKELPEYNFVPVFFVGSEDADLDELNHIELEGDKYVWNTNQTGAVGKMFVDKDLLKLIDTVEGRLLAEPFGAEIVTLLRDCYKIKSNIERATFLFVHHLFKRFGLVVYLPDNPAMKRVMISVFEDDIFKNTPEKLVQATSGRLSQHHHAQAFARNINLFYMKDNIRKRIVKAEGRFVVHETDISFTEEELKEELREHPERFSPNVILRGIFQEMTLPGIVFIGGGGELAYWLQLKDLFQYFKTPFPVLMLRNSFLIIEKKWAGLKEKLGLGAEELFLPYEQLLQAIIKRESKYDLSLTGEKAAIEDLYTKLSLRAGEIDQSLTNHILNLKVKQLKGLENVEKKFISAEKRNHDTTRRHFTQLIDKLFPGGGLQERTENFMLLYAKWGSRFFDIIYDASPTLPPSFCIITEKTGS